MKKLTSIILALALIVISLAVFASCDNGGKDETTTVADVTTAEETTAENKKQTLKMATNPYFQPYEYYDGTKIIGIDAEIAQAIADKLGMELVIEDMTFDSIITAVDSGSVDFGMAGMTVTEKRLESVDFSVSYASGVQVVIVKEGSTITSVDDLTDSTCKVGSQLGTTGYIYTSDTVENGGYGSDRAIGYTTGNEAISALLKGDIECVIIDSEPAKAFVANNQGLKILDTHYADEDYAICVKKGNSELLTKIDTAIYQLTEDGTISAIINKYIK